MRADPWLLAPTGRAGVSAAEAAPLAACTGGGVPRLGRYHDPEQMLVDKAKTLIAHRYQRSGKLVLYQLVTALPGTGGSAPRPASRRLRRR